MSKIAKNKTQIKQRIEELEKQALLLRKEIESEFEVTKNRVGDIGKLILGIGGGLIFSAIILGAITGRRKKDDPSVKGYKSKRVYHRFRDQLAHELTGQATDFLIGLAKDKLNAHKSKTDKEGKDDTGVST